MSKAQAVKLTLGGAPEVPHSVDGLPGTFVPGKPRSLDDVLTLDVAKAFIKDHDERVKKAKKDWDAFEKEQAELGFRPAGPQPFVTPPCPIELVDEGKES